MPRVPRSFAALQVVFVKIEPERIEAPAVRRVSSMWMRRGAGKLRSTFAPRPAAVENTTKRGSSTTYSLAFRSVGSSYRQELLAVRRDGQGEEVLHALGRRG